MLAELWRKRVNDNALQAAPSPRPAAAQVRLYNKGRLARTSPSRTTMSSHRLSPPAAHPSPRRTTGYSTPRSPPSDYFDLLTPDKVDKLRKFEYVPLWHFTEHGCQAAD